MKAIKYHLQTDDSHQVTLENLPIKAGSKVEVILMVDEKDFEVEPKGFPLKGSVLKYADPTEPAIDAAEWEAMQ